KKMLALHDVAFSSPQIGGHTDRLEVWFDEGQLPAPPPLAQQIGGVRHEVLKSGPVQKQMQTYSAEQQPPRSGVSVVRGPGASHPLAVVQAPGAVRPRRRTGNQALAKVDDKEPADAGEPNGPPKKSSPLGSENPLAVRAELIRVKAMREGEKTEIAEVITEG